MGIPPGYNMIMPVYFDFSVQTCITSFMLYFIYRTLCTSINPISSKTIQLLSLSPVFNTKHYLFYCFYTFPKVPFFGRVLQQLQKSIPPYVNITGTVHSSKNCSFYCNLHICLHYSPCTVSKP